MAKKTKEQEIREQIYKEQREIAERYIEYWFSEICDDVNQGYGESANRAEADLFGTLLVLASLGIITQAEFDTIDKAAWAVYKSGNEEV